MKFIFRAASILLLTSLFSCKKDQKLQPPPSRVNDTKTVKLKDVVVPSLPSPYYHFEYNDSGYVTKIGFADAMFDYSVYYSAARVSRMINVKNDFELSYQYESGKVLGILSRDLSTGEKKMYYGFEYYNTGQLKEIVWSRFESGNADSLPIRKVIMIYHADGNLAEFDDYRKSAVSNDLLWSQTTEFMEYDQAENPYDFSWVKDFFEDVIFLPQVRYQKNNPLRVKTTGQQNDYMYDYTYDINNRLVVARHVHMSQTRGGNADLRSTTTYSYY